MEFLKNITEEDVKQYTKKDSKNVNPNKNNILRVGIVPSQYNQLLKLEAFMKKEHNFKLFKSDMIKIAIQYLLDNVEDEEEFMELLRNHYMI